MPLDIADEDVDRLAEELATRQHVSKTEAVKRALTNEIHRLDKALPLWERIRPLQKRVQAHGSTGLEADKAFFDDLSGDA